jgi:hypothetical protein
MRMDVLVAQSSVSSQYLYRGCKKNREDLGQGNWCPHQYYNPRSELLLYVPFCVFCLIVLFCVLCVCVCVCVNVYCIVPPGYRGTFRLP